MAKTKRKHLADLDAEKKHRPLAVKLDPMPPHSVRHDREGGPTTDLSHTSSSSQKAVHEVEQAMKPALVAPSGDDSDSNSWVEVRKQRIVIIIPPLSKGKLKLLKTNQQVGNLHKDDRQCTQRKNRAKMKVSNTNVYDKRKWIRAIRALETENTAKRSIGKRVRGNVRTDVPPISSMDILLASALDTDHATCRPWQGKRTQEEVSLEKADSSAQPKNSLTTVMKGLKVPARSKKAGHMRTSLRASAHPNMARKRKVTQQATNDAHDDKKRPGVVDIKEKGCKYHGHRSVHEVATGASEQFSRMALEGGGSDSPVLSSSQAIKVITLKKHLQKAGGLRSWLCSVGLGQFKEAFGKRIWSERDLLQLQMDDLKKMGECAVGPRRKLIWAINNLSQQFI